MKMQKLYYCWIAILASIFLFFVTPVSALITDGYVTGSKIHMVGGKNSKKPYMGFILNRNEKADDKAVLNGDFDEAFQIYSKKADDGDIDAMHNLGLMYLRGLGVNKDPEQAAFYLKKSMDKLSNYATAEVYYNKALKEIQEIPQRALTSSQNETSNTAARKVTQPTSNASSFTNYASINPENASDINPVMLAILAVASITLFAFLLLKTRKISNSKEAVNNLNQDPVVVQDFEGMQVSSQSNIYEVPPSSPTLQTEDFIQALNRLSELKERGILTEEEFEAEKKRVLNIS